jgi:hypothetical protein
MKRNSFSLDFFYPRAASTIPISSSVRAYRRAPVDLPVRGLDAPLHGGILVRRADFRGAVYAGRATKFGKSMNADMISSL